MLEYISHDSLAKVKEILRKANLNREIAINIPSLELQFKSDMISETMDDVESGYKMDRMYLMYQESTSSLKIKSKKYEVFIRLGEWAYETNIPNSHLVLGTNPRRFGTDYFCQIELSQSIEDNEYIYIIKKISKLAGKGAIERLNRGLGSDTVKKRQRRVTLVDKLKADVIAFNEDEWLCVSKIDKVKIENEDSHAEILSDFLEDLLIYAFTIESIVNEKTDE